MKHVELLFLLFLSTFMGSCLNPERIIEKPDYGLRSSSIIEIEKIHLTDTTTVFYIDVHSRSEGEISIDPGTYLLADEQKYLLQSADSIRTEAEHQMPANGKNSFVLNFPALPKGTKKVDFLETDSDIGFKIWDIDLTGNLEQYKPELPDEMLNTVIDEKVSLPEPLLKIGTTKVTLHITGLRDGFVIGKPTIALNNFLAIEKEEITGKQEAEGRYVFEFEQYGTARGVIYNAGRPVTIILSPGENAEVYVDMTALSKRASRYHPQPELTYAGFKGEFAQVNNQLLKNYAKMGKHRTIAASIAYDTTVIDKTTDRYMQYVIDIYNEKNEWINDSIQGEGARLIASVDLKLGAIQCVAEMEYLYEVSYRIKHNDFDSRLPEDYTPPKPLDRKALLTVREFDPTDPFLFCLGENTGAVFMKIAQTYKELEDIIGNESRLLQDMYYSYPAIKKAKADAPLTEEEQSNLNAASSPFYTQAHAAMTAKVQQQVDQAMKKGGFDIMPTPEVSNDKLLEAIIAASNGKPVFVDFWATWCGPCVAAMKEMKPLKKEMAEHGMAAVYISYQGSPKAEWTGMLSDIGGIHYYLTNEQWKAIGAKYDIKGIPNYMIFDKTGNKMYQMAGFPGVDEMRKELAKVWQQ